MRDVIIASANSNAAEHIKTILQSGGIFAQSVFSTGSEVLSYTGLHTGALVICGKLSDMTAVSLANMLESGCDMIHLIPSGEAQTVFVSNMVTLYMPIERMDFLRTVKMLCATQDEKLQRREKNSGEEEILMKAKRIIMNRHHISEREAHKILQRRSMESGMKLVDVARMIGDE